MMNITSTAAATNVKQESTPTASNDSGGGRSGSCRDLQRQEQQEQEPAATVSCMMVTEIECRVKFSTIRGKDFHVERMGFWLKLAKREASEGNAKGVKNALQWAEKHAKKAERTVSVNEICNMLTAEKALEFNTARLGYFLEMAKSSASMGSRQTMEWDLKNAKEFAQSVGLDDEFQLQANNIRSSLSAEKELEVAIQDTHMSLTKATAAAEKGNMEEMARLLTWAEKSADKAGLNIEEKVRDICSALTPELDKQFSRMYWRLPNRETDVEVVDDDDDMTAVHAMDDDFM